MQSAYSDAIRDPAHNSTAGFDGLLTGQAKDAFDQSFASAKSAGVFYKGTPSSPRLTVSTNNADASLPEVVLINCPLKSGSDPFVAYYSANGTAVPTPTAAVPPPYAQTVKVFKLNGQWVITSYTTDDSQTCHA